MVIGVSIKQAEGIEAESVFDLVAGASPAARSGLGVEAVRLGGGVVLAAPGDKTGFLNRVLGLGVAEPVSAALVAEACVFLRDHGVKAAAIELASGTLPADWEEICAREGIERGSKVVKVGAEAQYVLDLAGAPRKLPGELRLASVQPDQAFEWSMTRLRAGGVPLDDHFTEVMASCVGRPGWYSFGVWDDDDLISGATMFVQGGVGRILGAATVPEARGRGAHAALIAARARAAVEAGSRWLVSEVGLDGEYASSASLRNMLNRGFEVLYQRQNWVWRAA